RRTVCPRCGAPVGIPSLQPATPGATLGPMTPAERVHARQVVRSGGLTSSAARPVVPPAEISVPPSSPASDATPVSVRPPLRFLSTTLLRQVNNRRSGLLRRAGWSPLTSRHPRGVETHGYQCLLHPFRAWSLVFGLAIMLTLFSGGIDLL